METRSKYRRHARAPSSLFRADWAATKDGVISLWLEYAKFVPRLLRESILHTDGCLRLCAAASEHGSMSQPMCDDAFVGLAVVDIRGFTRMTTDAGRSGPLGADALHKLLNAFFGKLMDNLEKYGGDVFKFAGDGIIVVFLPTEAEKECENMKELVSARAVQCIHNLTEEYGCVTISSSGDISSQKVDAANQDQASRSQESGGSPAIQEAVLSWCPEMQVDDDPENTITSRIEDSLQGLWMAFGASKWLRRPELPHSKGSWTCSRLNAKERKKQRMKRVFGSMKDTLRGAFMCGVTWRTQEAIKRILKKGKKTRRGLCPHAMTCVWKELRDPLGAHIQNMPTVLIKGIVSCGYVSFYRVSNIASSESNQICEVLMVDRDANSGPMHDVAVMDTVVKGGDTVISNALVSYLSERVTGEVLLDGIIRVQSIDPLSPHIHDATSSTTLDMEKAILENLDLDQCIKLLNMLKSHVPNTVKSLESKAYYNSQDSSVASEVFASDANMMISHRTCSIMFFRFLNLHDCHSKYSIQEVFETVQSHLMESGGDFLQMRNDEKGIVLIAGHGLPRYFSATKGNLGSLSVMCALKIIAALRKKGYNAVAGVTSGRVLFASVGSSSRCEYTIYGDPINLAARLMMHASTANNGPRLICDQETQTMCTISSPLRFVQIPDLHMKGFDRTLPAFTIEPDNYEDQSYDDLERMLILPEGKTPFHTFLKRSNSLFVGREDEIFALVDSTRRLQQEGIGSLLCLEDIAATGKTSLLKKVFFSNEYQKIENIQTFYFSTNKGEREATNGLHVLLQMMYEQPLETHHAINEQSIERLIDQFFDALGISYDERVTKCLLYLLQDYMKDGDQQMLQDEHSFNVLASALSHLVQSYVDVHGPCIIILDGLENAHPLIWRFARAMQESKITKLLLILSYRWAQIVFDQILSEREHQSQLTENEPELMKLFNDVGMSSYFGNMPISEIRSELMRDVCSIVLHPATKIMSLGEFTVENTKQFVTSIFPSMSLNNGVYQMFHDALGGHVCGIKFACMFLYLYHQKKWGTQKPPVGVLGVVLLHQVRTITPMWSAAEARFDSLPTYFKYVAVVVSAIGKIVPEEILYHLCIGIRKETVAKCVQALLYMKYMFHKLDKYGNSYYIWHHPILSLSILDMLAPDFRKEIRARLALVLEHYEFRSGLDFRSIAWFWRDSCRLSESIHWRRCLHAIAAYEDQACADIENSHYNLAQECLNSAIAIGLTLLHHQDQGCNIRVVPSWRMASWERCIAACECMKAALDFPKASQHCMRALALLGEDIRLSSTLSQPIKKDMQHSKHLLSKSGKKLVKSLANLGNPRTVVQYDAPDPNEPIKEIEGMTTFFLPRLGKSDEDEKEIERTNVLEMLMHIFESSGPWEPESLEFVSTSCQRGMATARLHKTRRRLENIQGRMHSLQKK